MNFYSFHIGDYLSATRHLSWVEDAAFRRLLDVYYTNEKPLPNDLRAVYRLVIASTDEQREAVETILNEFFEATPGGWVNHRADAEIEVMREKQQKQRDKANKRWHSHDKERGNASAMPRHGESDAAASKSDADAMPPIPIPIPIPIPREVPNGTSVRAKRPASHPAPDDVCSEVWSDWVLLRKAKHAPVSATVIAQARGEAEKASMTLEAFLREWVLRGSQGLKAEWLKGHVNGHVNGAASVKASKHTGFETKNYREGVDEHGFFSA